jgi:hypothetical protein
MPNTNMIILRVSNTWRGKTQTFSLDNSGAMIHIVITKVTKNNSLDILGSKQILYKLKRRSKQFETLEQSILHQRETILHSILPSVTYRN